MVVSSYAMKHSAYVRHLLLISPAGVPRPPLTYVPASACERRTLCRWLMDWLVV